jgi:sister chromatid cohesion protein DCC1
LLFCASHFTASFGDLCVGTCTIVAYALTMASTAVALSSAPDGRGYKLIELPAELQALLEGPSPPTMTVVSDPAHPAALVKTQDKTYSLRQKNTSNALMILQASDAAAQSGQEEGGEDDEKDGRGGLDVIATVHETFELVPEAAQGPAPIILQNKHSGSKGKWHERFGRNR